MMVKREADRIEVGSALPVVAEVNGRTSVVPPGLESLRGKYDSAIRTAANPIRQKYRDYLGGVMEELGGAWELTSAHAVQREIDSLGIPAKPDLAPSGRAPGLVICNQNNGRKNDRGSLRANLILYLGEEEVWRKNEVYLDEKG